MCLKSAFCLLTRRGAVNGSHGSVTGSNGCDTAFIWGGLLLSWLTGFPVKRSSNLLGTTENPVLLGLASLLRLFCRVSRLGARHGNRNAEIMFDHPTKSITDGAAVMRGLLCVFPSECIKTLKRAADMQALAMSSSISCRSAPTSQS